MSESTEIVNRDTIAVTPFKGLEIKTFEEAWRMATAIASSDLAPKDFKGKKENCLIAIQMGFELGLSPMQSIQNIAVINGRPCLWGDAMLAVVQGHCDFENIEETDDGNTATCKIKRRGRSVVVRTFSMEDAKKASLAGKQGPWSQYPQRMRQMRARGFALRDSFADALRGIASAEEARDYETIETDVPAHDVKLQRPKSIAEKLVTTPTPQSISEKLITNAQRTRLFAICGDLGVDEATLRKYLADIYQIESTSQIKKVDYDAICEWAKSGCSTHPDFYEPREPGTEG